MPFPLSQRFLSLSLSHPTTLLKSHVLKGDFWLFEIRSKAHRHCVHFLWGTCVDKRPCVILLASAPSLDYV